MYNGIFDQVQEEQAQSIPGPVKAEDLQNAFKIVYNSESLVSDIVTEQEEKDFSRYIKKSVATILQMKNSVLYPRSFLDARTKGLTVVVFTTISIDQTDTVLELVPNDWTLYVTNADEDLQVVMYIKLSTNNCDCK
jgi:hypothetical protein